MRVNIQPPGPNSDPGFFRGTQRNPFASLPPGGMPLIGGRSPVIPTPSTVAQNVADPGAKFLQSTGQRPIAGAGFNPFAAGNPMYGATPNLGPMRDKTPFQERDLNALRLRNAMMKRLRSRLGNRG